MNRNVLSKFNIVVGSTGLLLGICSLVCAVFFPSNSALTAGLAMLSLMLLFWLSIVNRHEINCLARKQSTVLRLNNAAMIVLFLFSVIMVNLILRQYYFRVDISSSHHYTLAPQSNLVANSLDREVEILFFGTEGSKEFQRVHDLLEMYRYLNKKIVYSLYDLDRVPLKAKEFQVTDYNTLVLRSADRTISSKGAGEEAITNLLIRGTRRKALTVRYLLGHNERTLSETDRDGYGKIIGQLSAQGFQVQPLDLKGADLKVGDTDLLIVAAPKVEMPNDEYRKVWRYLEDGGKALVLVDGPDQADQLIRGIGVSASPEPVYDARNVAGSDPASPLVTSYPDTPITRGFGLSTVYPGVHALRYREGLMLDYKFEPLVMTSDENWLEKHGNRTREADEADHPLTIAAIVSHPNKLMKVVIFGDSDFVSNTYLGVAGNANLFLNTVSWLCGEGSLISVAPVKTEFVPMIISDRQSRLIALLAPVGVPLFIFAAGAVIWFKRRRL